MILLKDKETIFLSGKVTGDENYREKFAKEQKYFEKLGFVVLSPCVLPSEGFTYEQYMTICEAMINSCDYIYFLEDFVESEGSMREFDKVFKNQISSNGESKPKIINKVGKILEVGKGENSNHD